MRRVQRRTRTEGVVIYLDFQKYGARAPSEDNYALQQQVHIVSRRAIIFDVLSRTLGLNLGLCPGSPKACDVIFQRKLIRIYSIHGEVTTQMRNIYIEHMLQSIFSYLRYWPNPGNHRPRRPFLIMNGVAARYRSFASVEVSRGDPTVRSSLAGGRT